MAHTEIGHDQEHFATETDSARRFGGVARLYGASALDTFRRSHVTVVGIGGVGSWAVEALARSAIGKLTLIDLDMIAESNVNRQAHALAGEFGRAKVSGMAQRIRLINPRCEVHEIEDFVTPENVAQLLCASCDYVIDATDQVRTKAAMIAWAKPRGVPLITAGSAGGQLDPTRIAITDLARTIQDPLLARVRSRLRRECGFPRDPRRKFGIPAVFSTEAVRPPLVEGACGERPSAGGLSCAGFGSTVCVTATFGFIAAGEVLQHLASRRSTVG
ncbi:MAG: tRNA threonylcarbamoyladenosine dehydratase [Candidatus Accumulibacter sp.]|uniref:tRNA threonylcarbamoyladenosine dehydratase n=1 Tax=Accumulibacter sp. TaxID=2053492 RepID=UPI00287922E4|nr:tRNA threonylcarbamoyladenosine dehydratase [Accumulibacter sp.]MDS4016025.1 tRNA threonylcarbamoyladenosine dehydratase [Accumulibacter sp.]